MDLMETLNDYLASLEISENKHLLVEGPTDKELFEKLLDRLLCFDTGEMYHNIEIDLVENLDVPSQRGNRGKVEFVCEAISKDQRLNSQNILFAGFVDREFDEFDLDELRDLLGKHYVNNYLVWSRGHSLENYLFEYSLFSDLLWHILDINWTSQILAKLKVVFDKVIKLACVIGLVGHDLKKLIFIRNNIHCTMLKIENEEVYLDFKFWKQKLLEEGLLDSDFEELMIKYSFYSEKVTNAEITTVKWLCDAHLGLNFIIFASWCCIRDEYAKRPAPKPSLDKLTGIILGLQEDKKWFYQCAKWWARKVQEQQCEYPRELFLLLKIPYKVVEYDTDQVNLGIENY